MKRRRFSARAVLFDWDGTYRQFLRRRFARLPRDVSLPRHQVGPRAISPATIHPTGTASIAPRVCRALNGTKRTASGLSPTSEENPRLMPGARQLIRSLKREFVLGVVTSGNRPQGTKAAAGIRAGRLFFHVRLLRRRTQEETSPRSTESGARADWPGARKNASTSATRPRTSKCRGAQAFGRLAFSAHFLPPNGFARLAPMPSSTRFANCRSIYSGSKNPPTDGRSINFFRPLPHEVQVQAALG